MMIWVFVKEEDLKKVVNVFYGVFDLLKVL